MIISRAAKNSFGGIWNNSLHAIEFEKVALRDSFDY
jgi:hypothetical protein